MQSKSVKLGHRNWVTDVPLWNIFQKWWQSLYLQCMHQSKRPSSLKENTVRKTNFEQILSLPPVTKVLKQTITFRFGHNETSHLRPSWATKPQLRLWYSRACLQSTDLLTHVTITITWKNFISSDERLYRGWKREIGMCILTWRKMKN